MYTRGNMHMDGVREIRRSLDDIKYEASVVRYVLAFRKLMRAVKAGFNEEQPRDERGRWTVEGAIEVTTYDGFLTGIPTIDNTSEALSNILTKVIAGLEYLPDMKPQTYDMVLPALSEPMLHCATFRAISLLFTTSRRATSR